MSYARKEGLGIAEAYNVYKSNVKSHGEKVKVDKSAYNTVIKLFFKYMKRLLFENGDRVILPYKLGMFQIIGLKQKIQRKDNGWVKGLVPNWGETYKLWREHPEYRGKKFIYYTNEHSDGVRYKFYWSKKDVPYLCKPARKFNLTYRNRKEIYNKIMDDYVPYEIYDKISDVTKNIKK